MFLAKKGKPIFNSANINVVFSGNSLMEGAGQPDANANYPNPNTRGQDQYLSYQVKLNPLFANSGMTFNSWGRGGLAWSGLTNGGYLYEDTSLQVGKRNILIAWEGINCFGVSDVSKSAATALTEVKAYVETRKNAGWDEVYIITSQTTRIEAFLAENAQRYKEYNDGLKFNTKYLSSDGAIDIVNPNSPLYMTGYSQADWVKLNPYFITTESFVTQTNPLYVHMNTLGERTIVAPLVVQKLRSIGAK